MHLYKMTKTISETVQSRSNYSEATCTVVTVAFPNILVQYWLCKKVRSYTLFRGPVHLIMKCSIARNSKVFKTSAQLQCVPIKFSSAFQCGKLLHLQTNFVPLQAYGRYKVKGGKVSVAKL